MVEICMDEMLKTGVDKNEYTLEEILSDVCDAMGQPIAKVKSRDRHKEYTICRQIYSYVSRIHTKYSLSQMSKVVGYEDHTTIIANDKKVKAYLRLNDPSFIDHWEKYTENSNIWNRLYKK